MTSMASRPENRTSSYIDEIGARSSSKLPKPDKANRLLQCIVHYVPCCTRIPVARKYPHDAHTYIQNIVLQLLQLYKVRSKDLLPNFPKPDSIYPQITIVWNLSSAIVVLEPLEYPSISSIPEGHGEAVLLHHQHSSSREQNLDGQNHTMLVDCGRRMLPLIICTACYYCHTP